MYGTVARFTVKPGRTEDFVALMQEFERDRAPSVKGWAGTWVYQLDEDPNSFMLAVGFSDRDAYRANADDPAQDKWYQRMREHLTEDPAWHDGEIVHVGKP